jgi:hypothetical protein
MKKITNPTVHRPLLLAGLLALGIVALSGCANGSLLPGQRAAAQFDDYARFSKDADLVFRTQEWVPKDAADITTDAYTSKPGNVIGFESTTAVDSPDCAAGDLTGKPPFETSWWPSSQPATGFVCGDWQVFTTKDHWYAWTN